MKTLISTALKFENNKLLVLNQKLLPQQQVWLHAQTPAEMAEIIYSLKVRGAPLIGIAAALSLARYAESGVTATEIQAAAELLIASRPTAVNLSHCITRQIQAYQANPTPETIVAIAEQLFAEDALLCAAISQHGAELIESGDGILTHCNTGSLVTTGIGTALGVITTAHQQGKNIHVYVSETRPLLQGARLTAWELAEAGIPHTLICDNMCAALMRSGKIQRVIVGADRIAKNGDTANKIGTYSAAALARFHNIPFYVAAPYTTFDETCANGEAIIIEQRAAQEVQGAEGGFGQVAWASPASPVDNPAFDVTPAELISAFITNRGVSRNLAHPLAFEPAV